jgi:O-antigen/teichoic acid export membrane protein
LVAVRQLRATASPPPPSSRLPERNLSRLAGSAGLMFAGGWIAYALSTLFQIAVARGIGAEEFGAYILAVGIAWVLAQIAPLGMTWAVVRYVAIYRAQGDDTRLMGTVWLAIRTTAIGGAVLGTGMFLTAPLLAERVFHEPRTVVLLRLLSLAVPLSALTDLLLATVQAYTRMIPTVVVRSVAVPFLRLAGALGALAIFGGGALTVACGYLTVEFIAMLMAAVAALRVLPRRAGRYPGRQVGQYARPLAAQRVLESSTADFGDLVLAASHSVGLVALFTAVLRFTEVGNALFKAIGQAIAPMVSDIHTAEQRDHLARLYKAASRWLFMIGLPIFLTQLLFGRWLLSLFGDDFVVAYPALIVVAVGQLANYCTGVTQDVIRMIGRSGLLLVNTIFDVCNYVILNLVLIPRFGLMGAAYAAAIELAIINVVRAVEVWFIARMHPYSRSFAKPLVAALGAVAAAWAVQRLPLPSAVDELVGMLVMGVTYLALLAAVRLDPDDQVIFRRLVGRLRGGVRAGAGTAPLAAQPTASADDEVGP